MHLKAYGDNTQYSIGWGTKAKRRNEVITKEEAQNRLNENLSWRVDKVIKEHPTKKPNEQAALVSLLYNYPRGYYRVGKTAKFSDFDRPGSLGGHITRQKNEWALYLLGVMY